MPKSRSAQSNWNNSRRSCWNFIWGVLIAIHLAFLFLTLPVFLHQVRDDGYNENLFKRFPKHPACGFTFIYSCSTSIVNFILIRIEFERNLVNSTEQPLDRDRISNGLRSQRPLHNQRQTLWQRFWPSLVTNNVVQGRQGWLNTNCGLVRMDSKWII